MENGILKNFAKFTGKHLCRSLLLIKLQGPTFSCEFCEIYKNTFLQNTSGWLFLNTDILYWITSKSPELALHQTFIRRPICLLNMGCMSTKDVFWWNLCLLSSYSNTCTSDVLKKVILSISEEKSKKTSCFFNPLMPGDNKKVTHT